MTNYYTGGKRISFDGVPCKVPTWYGQLGNDAEYREATKPRDTFKAGYYEGGHRLTIGGVPTRLAGHVKDWPTRLRSVLGKGTAARKEQDELKRQARALGLTAPPEMLGWDAGDFSCPHCRRLFNFHRGNAYDFHGCAFPQKEIAA